MRTTCPGSERVTTWAKVEGQTRPGRARLAARLLKAFCSWCAECPAYSEIMKSNPAKNKAAREQLVPCPANIFGRDTTNSRSYRVRLGTRFE